MGKVLQLTILAGAVRDVQTHRSFPVRIGRDPSFECPLGFRFVSRRHARIELEGDGLVLHDDGSRFGTFVHDLTRRVYGSVVLADVGDEFQIGQLTLRAELVDDDARPSPQAGTLNAHRNTEAALDETRARHEDTWVTGRAAGS